MQVVWFKRDLRVRDHAPLKLGSARGPCLCLYVYEPELMRSAHFDPSHLVFVNESLAELDGELRALGAHLTLRVGDMPDVLDALHKVRRIEGLWSHEEIGDGLTYARDRRVRAWARHAGAPWHEARGAGVFRALPSRDGWAKRWETHMRHAPVATPNTITPVPGIEPQRELLHLDHDLGPSRRSNVQAGGMRAGEEALDSFLHARGRNYRSDMSSPVEGWDGCSRLSPYLAFGNLSMREVYQRTETRVAQLKASRRRADRDPEERDWSQSMQSFGGRLRWHCHFMQKLEDEPAIEFRNMNRAYDGLRENAFDSERFEAWCTGQTGYPMVDACMRALHAHGWVNFRMRAMLVSFASYQLWLHWRPTALHLAKLFLDFEPGIHYSQMQMQSGTTGINALRIYSPAKQVRDQDPRGVFIRRYCPELADVPDEYLPEPHTMPPLTQQMSGCVIGRDYPKPIVDHARAYREAKRRIGDVRGRGDERAEARVVFEKHGSRRRPRTPPPRTARRTSL